MALYFHCSIVLRISQQFLVGFIVSINTYAVILEYRLVLFWKYFVEEF